MLMVLLLAAVATPNLVANPTFTEGIYDPEAWSLNTSEGNRAAWVCHRGDPKRCAARLSGSGRDWAGATDRAVPARPGETLTVAAWVQVENASPDRDFLYVRFFGSGGFRGQWGPAVPQAAPQWTLLAGTVTAPDDCSQADVSLQIRSQGTVTLGAVGLFRGDVAARAAELLPRPAAMDPVPVDVPRGLPADTNRNGLADAHEEFLRIPAAAKSVRHTRRNTTCFQTPTGYRADNDLKVGSVLVVNESREAIRSWQQMGYAAYFMTGFRDGPAYLQQHPGSVQQAKGGQLLDCGPGSYYMVPTEDRRRVKRDEFRRAFENAAEGAAPEEPEFIGTGGYSPAFKREFEAFYGRPWVAPDTSPQARVDCQRLMGHLEVELLRACYEGAHSVNPKAPAFLLCHSPLNYSAWGITFPHYETISKLKIDQMIAQVWTGTARSAINHQGVTKERTFENAYLEYSSSLNLVRGKGIPTWLLMDPVEDNPDRPMEDYFYNYKRTLGASLLFPETDLFEVMPWPTRIFGRVPPEFATVICTIVTMLGDLQHHHFASDANHFASDANHFASDANPRAVHDRGTEGIASFLADSAMWQRHAPSPADFDAVYGLTLPLLMRGIPVELAHLDRVGEKDYLKPYRVLLASFDAMKPARKENVDGLVAWVKAGGQLLLFGGDDAYNDIDLWWKQEGCASPHEYLLKALGLHPKGMKSLQRPGVDAPFRVAAKTDYTGRKLENRGVVRIDLSEAVRDTGAAFVKLEDSIPGDGWGPWIGGLRLVGTRGGRPLDVAVKPGTPEEGALIFSDTGSGFTGEARFVDAHHVLVYRFAFDPGTQAAVEIDLGNHYCVSVGPAPKMVASPVRRVRGSALAKALDTGVFAGARSILAYPKTGGTPVLTSGGGAVLSEAKVGKGGVLVCGLPAATFAKSPAADRMLRTLVRHACGKRGIAYREQGHIGIQRGPYQVVKTFDEATRVDGPAIDLTSPDLALRPAGPLGPDDLVILCRLPKQAGLAPVVAASSALIEWSATEGNELRLVASGPSGVQGVMRLVTGGKRLTVSARDAFGAERPVRVEPQGDTALLRFNTEPHGLAMRIQVE